MTSLKRPRTILAALRTWRRGDDLVVRKDLFDDALAKDPHRRS